VAPLTLNLDARCTRVISFTPRFLYPRGKISVSIEYEAVLSPTAGPDAVQQLASLRDDVMELHAFGSSALVACTLLPLDPQGRSPQYR